MKYMGLYFPFYSRAIYLQKPDTYGRSIICFHKLLFLCYGVPKVLLVVSVVKTCRLFPIERKY